MQITVHKDKASSQQDERLPLVSLSKVTALYVQPDELIPVSGTKEHLQRQLYMLQQQLVIETHKAVKARAEAEHYKRLYLYAMSHTH